MLTLEPVPPRWVPLAGTPYFVDASAATAVLYLPGGVRLEAKDAAARDLVRPVGWTLALVAAVAGAVGIAAKTAAPAKKRKRGR